MNKAEAPKLRKAVFSTMKQIEPDKRVNLAVKVADIKETARKKRFDGTTIVIGDVLVGDEFGTINLVAKNEQLESLKVGDSIIIRNGHTKVVDGFMRLEVDRWGKIEKATEPLKEEVNRKNNLSEVEYELVPVKGGK